MEKRISGVNAASYGWANFSIEDNLGAKDIGRHNGLVGGTIIDGSTHIEKHDPSFTRWLPLDFSPRISNQPFHDVSGQLPPPWGNLNCAYAIAMYRERNPDLNGEAVFYSPGLRALFYNEPTYVIIDANGDRLSFDKDFKPNSDILSTFTKSDTGFTISHAGPPGQMRERGHYTYTFGPLPSSNVDDPQPGRLLSITDDLGNEQDLTYPNQGTSAPYLIVTDQTSGRKVLFYSDGGYLTQVVAPLMFSTTPAVTTRLYNDGYGRVTSMQVHNGGVNGPLLSQDNYGYDLDSPTIITQGTTTQSNTYVSALFIDLLANPTRRLTTSSFGLDIDHSSSDDGGSVQGTISYHYGALTDSGSLGYGVEARTNTVTDARGNTTEVVYQYRNPLLLQDNGVISQITATAPAFTGADGPTTVSQIWSPDITKADAVQLQDPLGNLWKTQYTSRMPTRFTDPLQHQWQFTYNGLELASILDPTNQSWQFTYGLGGNLTSIIDPAQRVLANVTYNVFGQVQTVTNPAAVAASGQDETESVAYDTTTGDLVKAIGATGDQWVAGIVDPSTHTVVPGTDYDALGDLRGFSLFPDTGSALTSLTPLSSTLQYDATQMPIRLTGPTGTSIAYNFTQGTLDSFSIQNQGSNLGQVSFLHDTRGRLYRSDDVIGRLFELRYDRDSNPTQFRDGNGVITTYYYGANGEPTGMVWPDGIGSSILYTRAGQTKQTTDERGVVANYTYDNANRLQTIEIPSDPNRNTAFVYDNANRLLSATDAAGNKVEYTYDQTDKRLTGITTTQDGYAYTLSYAYYGDGKVLLMTSPVGATHYVYGPDGTLTSLTNPFGETTTWSHDHAGRMTGQTTTTGSATVATTYGYGTSGQPTDPSTAPAYLSTITNTVNGTTVGTYQLTHSYQGQMLAQSGTIGSTGSETANYAYDARGRLQSYAAQYTNGFSTASAGGIFSYDLSNNLFPLSNDGAAWVYNNSNQVTAAPSVQNTGGTVADTDHDANLTGDESGDGSVYDAAGNQTALQNDTLTYDTLGNLASIAWTTTGFSLGSTVNHSVTFTYDLLGRRASKTVDGAATTRYLYDGALLIAEVDAGTGTITRAYTWGAQGLISDNQADQGSQFYLYDASNNTRLLVDSDGEIVWQQAYSAWGTPLRPQSPAITNATKSTNARIAPTPDIFNPNPTPPPPPTPFAWNGRIGNYTDGETGLVQIGARYYSPAVGRFLSRDPSGYASGSNVYAFALDDPINFCDADGECPAYWAAMALGGAAVGAGVDGFLAYRAGARGGDLLSAIGRGAFAGGAAGFATGLLGPEAGASVWGAMGAGALGSAAGNVAGQAYDNATGAQSGFSFKSLFKDALIGGVTGGVMHGAGELLSAAGIRCFDGDTLVPVAPQVAFAASATGKTTAIKGRASKAVPSPKVASATKKIREIRKGDAVATRNLRTGKTEYKRVLNVFVHNAPELVAVSIANKKTGKIVEVIKATPEHPFFTTHGLVAAGQLGIGTELVTRAGPQKGDALVVAKVEKIAVEAGGHPVYNLEVEDDHTYFVGSAAGGVWVHNSCTLYSLITRRAIRNSRLGVLGRSHPATGVPFTPDGFPDFSGHLYTGGPSSTTIRYTGSYTGDYAAANANLGYQSTPAGFIWHHHQDGTTMQLVNEAIHVNTGHTGGVSFWEALNGQAYRP